MIRIFLGLATLILLWSCHPAPRPASLPLDVYENSNPELTELAWLEGRWQAEAFGGDIEEVWLPAMGNSMQAVFRVVVEESLHFSEFIQVTVEDAGTVMRFNHFNPDYSTWEGDGPPMELLLKSADSNEIVFEAKNKTSPSKIVYRLVQGDLHVSVTGLEDTIVFYRR